MSYLVTYQSCDIPNVWEEVKGYIESALIPSNYTVDDILAGLCNKKMQLWVWKGSKIYGALVTMIQTKNEITFCLFLALGGSKIEEWKDHLYLVEDWAKTNGCTEMRIYGRRGWARKFNFDIDYTKMTRKL